MKKSLTLAMTAFAIASGPVMTAPAFAQSRAELRDDRQDLRREQRQLDNARTYGDRGDVREQRQDVREARQELREDRRDRRNVVRNRDDYRTYQNYNYDRPDPRYGNYRAERYYRQGNYQDRRLGRNDRIYRGGDGRYYCRRDDGTTGLIVGALGGGALGNVIAPGGSKTLGTILGGGVGALLGRSIDRGGATCR